MGEMVNANWIKLRKTDPGLFVNRQAKVEELRGWLDGLIEAGETEGSVLVTGERGVGKSIFTRAVARAFAARNRERVVLLEVDCRGVGWETFPGEVAKELARVGREVVRYAGQDHLQAWLTQLELLATRPKITRSQIESISTTQGATVGLSVGLFEVLAASGGLAWEHRKELGQTVEMTLEVTDQLLARAVERCLEELASKGFLVVVFFNDLDQALLPGEPDNAVEALMRTLAIKPCVRLVHLRSEMLSRDIRREIEETVELQAMTSTQLMQIVDHRLMAAPEPLREKIGALSSIREAFERLAGATDNPMVFLQWCYGLLRTRSFPGTWQLDSSDTRRLIAQKVGSQGEDFPSVQRLVETFERVSGGEPWCKREALSKSDEREGLSEEEMKRLDRLGLLQLRNHFEDDPELRLDPVLRILLVDLGVSGAGG